MPDIREITLQPEPSSWLGLIAQDGRRTREVLFGIPVGDWRDRMRHEMLPGWTLHEGAGRAEQPIIGTGHQAEFWHAGVLAKYLAMDALAECIDAAVTVELVVDQDVNDPLALRVPVEIRDSASSRASRQRFDTKEIRLDHAPAECPVRCDETWAVPLAYRRPIHRCDSHCWVGPADQMHPDVEAGLDRIRDALGKHAPMSDSLAEQVALANSALRGRSFEWRVQDDPSASMESEAIRTARDHSGERSCFLILATELAKTSLFRALVEEMRGDPMHMFETYNAAAARFPHAHISPLDERGACENRADGFEIPLWRIDPETRRRHRACVGDLDDENAILWPRALLMTALVRLGLVDLFVHGRGGEEYERVTEQWIADWLDVSLAPMIIVSATMLLDFGIEPATADDLSQARWFAHHLQYNLDRHVAGEEESQQRKRDLLRAIENAPRRSTERLAAYLELQNLNRDLRERHVDELTRARRRIDERTEALAESHLLLDRTWAFPFHTTESRRRLKEQLAARIAGDSSALDDTGTDGSAPQCSTSDSTVISTTLGAARESLSCGCGSDES